MTKLPTIDDCRDCGVCCRHMGYPPYLRGEGGGQVEPAWTAMDADLKRSLIDYMETYQVPEGQLDGPCIWFNAETNLCRHHESRPKVCRDFRIGSQGCRDWRAAYGIV